MASAGYPGAVTTGVPIGGLREKSVAAHRGLIRHVIIPKNNERDLEDVRPIGRLTVRLRQWLEDVVVFFLEVVVFELVVLVDHGEVVVVVLVVVLVVVRRSVTALGHVADQVGIEFDVDLLEVGGLAVEFGVGPGAAT